jgi:hypothetical protein
MRARTTVTNRLGQMHMQLVKEIQDHGKVAFQPKPCGVLIECCGVIDQDLTDIGLDTGPIGAAQEGVALALEQNDENGAPAEKVGAPKQGTPAPKQKYPMLAPPQAGGNIYSDV